MRDDHVWIESRIDAALNARRSDVDAASEETWVDRLAAAHGVPVAIVRNLEARLRDDKGLPGASISNWLSWILDWLEENASYVPALLRSEGLESVFGTEYKRLTTDRARGLHAVPAIRILLPMWMGGRPIAELELKLGTAAKRLATCSKARAFVLRLVPEIAYVCGLVVQTRKGIESDSGGDSDLPLGLSVLSNVVREGFDAPELLALRHLTKGQPSRRSIHREYARIRALVPDEKPNEDIESTFSRVKLAVVLAK
jgi:hypothetical protein